MCVIVQISSHTESRCVCVYILHGFYTYKRKSVNVRVRNGWIENTWSVENLFSVPLYAFTFYELYACTYYYVYEYTIDGSSCTTPYSMIGFFLFHSPYLSRTLSRTHPLLPLVHVYCNRLKLTWHLGIWSGLCWLPILFRIQKTINIWGMVF